MARGKNPNIVLPGAIFEYTSEQAREMLRCAMDPVHFIRSHARIVHPLKGVVPFDLYNYQEGMIREIHGTDEFIAILSSRQIGKSIVACAYILWYICFNEHKRVHIVSNKNVNAMEMINRIQFMYENLPNWLKPGIDISNWNKHALGFGNGCVIESEATTEQSGRGKSIALLFCLGGDTDITVRNKITGIIESTTLSELYTKLHKISSEFANNVSYEILTPTGWGAFKGVTKSYKKLQFIKIQGSEIGIWASKDHGFYISNILTKVKHLSKYGKIDGVDRVITYRKTNKFKWQASYDIIESKNDHKFVIHEHQIITKNCDEFAFVNPTIAEEFWTSISPTLATGGRAIIASTPNGDTNLFASIWRGAEMGSNGFKAIFVPWDAPPGRDEEFKQKQIAKIGILKWQQEYECRFISSDPLLIDSIYLNEYKRDKINKVQPTPDARGIIFFEPIIKDHTYIVGVDPSTGNGNDYSVIEVFSYPELSQVAEFRSNTTASPLLYTTLKYILKTLESKGVTLAYMSIENNGVGEGMLTAYQLDENTCAVGDLISDKGSKRLGMVTTGRNKAKSCINLKQLFEYGKLQINSILLINEMQNYIKSGGSYAARRGSTDDCISAVLIVLRIIEELVMYEDTAFNLLYGASDNMIINEFGEVESIEPEAMILRAETTLPQYQIRGGFHDINDIDSFDPFLGSSLWD